MTRVRRGRSRLSKHAKRLRALDNERTKQFRALSAKRRRVPMPEAVRDLLNSDHLREQMQHGLEVGPADPVGSAWVGGAIGLHALVSSGMRHRRWTTPSLVKFHGTVVHLMGEGADQWRARADRLTAHAATEALAAADIYTAWRDIFANLPTTLPPEALARLRRCAGPSCARQYYWAATAGRIHPYCTSACRNAAWRSRQPRPSRP